VALGQQCLQKVPASAGLPAVLRLNFVALQFDILGNSLAFDSDPHFCCTLQREPSC